MLDLLKKEGAPTAQAESVAEAVIRHQDLGETGFVTSITAVVLLATIFGEFGFFSYNPSCRSFKSFWWGRGWWGWRGTASLWWGRRGGTTANETQHRQRRQERGTGSPPNDRERHECVSAPQVVAVLRAYDWAGDGAEAVGAYESFRGEGV